MHNEKIGSTNFTFKMVDTQELLHQVYSVRFQVYCKECGFIDPQEYPEEKETDRYDKYSLHFVAIEDNRVIGTARLVLDNKYGFPMEEHVVYDPSFNFSSIDRRYTAEISRLTISREFRRRRDDGLYYSPDYKAEPEQKPGEVIKRIKPMAFGLYKEMYQECKRRGITHCFALMEKTLWLLLKIHHFTFDPIGPEVDLYGPVRPYICDIAKMESILSQKSPKLFSYLTDGLEQHLMPGQPNKAEADA